MERTRPDPEGLVLNALLGLGTALAPVFVAAFTGLGFWIGLPVLAACLLAGLIAVSLRLPLDPEPAQPSGAAAVAAFGVGPLTSAGVPLPTIFAASAAVAVILGGLSGRQRPDRAPLSR